MDVHVVTNSYIGKAGESHQFRSNLTQDQAIAQRSSLNSSFSSLAGADLEKIAVITRDNGVLVELQSDKIHDVNGYLSIHAAEGTMAQVLGRDAAFKAALTGITNFPVLALGVVPDDVDDVDDVDAGA